jgi:hypothetical protein
MIWWWSLNLSHGLHVLHLMVGYSHFTVDQRRTTGVTRVLISSIISASASQRHKKTESIKILKIKLSVLHMFQTLQLHGQFYCMNVIFFCIFLACFPSQSVCYLKINFVCETRDRLETREWKECKWNVSSRNGTRNWTGWSHFSYQTCIFFDESRLWLLASATN